MPDVKALKNAVQNHLPTALAELCPWFADFDSATWDGQLEEATARKFDSLPAKSREDHDSLPHRLQ